MNYLTFNSSLVRSYLRLLIFLPKFQLPINTFVLNHILQEENKKMYLLMVLECANLSANVCCLHFHTVNGVILSYWNPLQTFITNMFYFNLINNKKWLLNDKHMHDICTGHVALYFARVICVFYAELKYLIFFIILPFLIIILWLQMGLSNF